MSPTAAPALTVVVPVLDGAATLGRCLAALVAALPAGGEIVVVDDGSTDESRVIAGRFPVTVLGDGRRRGTSGARNLGWRYGRGELVVFVDADVEVRSDALIRLRDALLADPALAGINGALTLVPGTPGLISDFVNLSIHYQHLRHRRHHCAAFTSIFMVWRAALEAMGGWDERLHSRYADDVATRFLLPDARIGMDAGAQGTHHKQVKLAGMMKHRFKVGYFFVRSCADHRAEVLRHPARAVLDLRYPLNTVAAALSLGCAALGPLAGPALLAPLALQATANARFVAFTARTRGPLRALVAGPLSVAEGYAYLGGMAAGALSVLGSRR